MSPTALAIVRPNADSQPANVRLVATNPAPTPAANAEPLSWVNLAARQRMLSQRTILQTVLAAAGDRVQLAAAQKSLQLFSDSQAKLLKTITEFDETSGRRVKDTYHGPRGVGLVIEQFIETVRNAHNCISAQTPQMAKAVSALVACTDSVLEALNTATTTFDTIAKTKADLIMRELTTIVSDIQTVAREAKVVSFNAQVMAARAGAHGREFAVVANVLSGITVEIDGLSRKAIDLAARNR